jgi:hypothetical protein
MACLLFASTLYGSTVEQMSVDRMAREAILIVEGEVSGLEPQYEKVPWGRLITTLVRVRVQSTLKGTAESSIGVRVIGGTIGSERVEVDDAPMFDPGDHVVLFLANGRPGEYTVLGLYQGSFHVGNETGEEKIRGRDELRLRAEFPAEGNTTLPAFKALIRQKVAESIR